MIIARIKAREEPVPEPMAVKLAEGPTVAEIAERYLEEHVVVRCKPKTALMYRLIAEKYIVPRLRQRPAGVGIGRQARRWALRRRRCPVPAGREVLHGPLAELRHGEVVQERRVLEPDSAFVLGGEQIPQSRSTRGLVGFAADETGDGGGRPNPFVGQQAFHPPGPGGSLGSPPAPRPPSGGDDRS